MKILKRIVFAWRWCTNADYRYRQPKPAWVHATRANLIHHSERLAMTYPDYGPITERPFWVFKMEKGSWWGLVDYKYFDRRKLAPSDLLDHVSERWGKPLTKVYGPCTREEAEAAVRSFTHSNVAEVCHEPYRPISSYR